jgi:hypothetical protein
MLRIAGCLLVLSFVCASFADAEQLSVKITKPANGDTVGDTADLEGKVSDAKAKVWIIVRPTETSDYWVQSEVAVNENGTWSGEAHIGRPGDDVRKSFAVRVVANPKAELREGQVLSRWPAAAALSEIVKVKKGQ